MDSGIWWKIKSFFVGKLFLSYGVSSPRTYIHIPHLNFRDFNKCWSSLMKIQTTHKYTFQIMDCPGRNFVRWNLAPKAFHICSICFSWGVSGGQIIRFLFVSILKPHMLNMAEHCYPLTRPHGLKHTSPVWGSNTTYLRLQKTPWKIFISPNHYRAVTEIGYFTNKGIQVTPDQNAFIIIVQTISVVSTRYPNSIFFAISLFIYIYSYLPS